MRKALRILNLADCGAAQLFLKDMQSAGYTLIHQEVADAGRLVQALEEWDWDLLLAGGKETQGLVETALDWFHNKPESGALLVLCDDEVVLTENMRGVETCAPMYYTAGKFFPLCISRALENLSERKRCRRTETALRVSEAEYRTVIEDQTELVCRFLPDGTLTFVNNAYTRSLNRSREDLVGRNLRDFIARSSYDQLFKKLAGLTPENPSLRGVDKMTILSGETRWIEWVERALYDGNGNLFEYQSIGRDVTEQRLAEDALKKERNFLSAILDTASELVIVLDPQGFIVSFNRASEQLTGYTFEEVRGKSFVDLFIPPEDRASIRATFEQILDGNIPLQHENVWRTRNGEFITIDWTNTALLDDTGRVEFVIATGVDVTRRKKFEDEIQRLNRELEQRVRTRTAELEATTAETRRAETRLKLSEARFRTVFEGAPIGIVLSGWDGRAIEENNAFLNMLGYSREELHQMHFMEVSHPEDIEDHLALVQQLREGKRDGFTLEKRYIKKDGDVLWGRLNVRVVHENQGEPAFVISMLEDITKRKVAEEKLKNALSKEKELNELKSRFISMTSHEFRTPLSTILSSAELLEHYGSQWKDEKRLQHLHRIQEAVSHLDDMLKDILVIGRADAGQMQNHPAAIDLLSFCQNLREEVFLGDHERHPVEFRVHGGCSQAFLDEKLLRQALANLLSNAIKYSPPGSPVRLEMDCRDTEFVFSVRDQGIGIPPDDLKRLCEPFFRAGNAGHAPGTGLGLTVVKRSVETMGGQISFSSSLGAGSTFTVSLPRDPDQIVSERSE
jgi:PAS domain S-box-containing protein